MLIDSKFGSPSFISLRDIVVHTDKKDLFMPTAYKYPSRLQVLGIQNRNNISSLSFMRTAAIEIGISSKESQRMLIIEFENKHNNRTKTRTTTTTKKKTTHNFVVIVGKSF